MSSIAKKKFKFKMRRKRVSKSDSSRSALKITQVMKNKNQLKSLTDRR